MHDNSPSPPFSLAEQASEDDATREPLCISDLSNEDWQALSNSNKGSQQRQQFDELLTRVLAAELEKELSDASAVIDDEHTLALFMKNAFPVPLRDLSEEDWK